MKPETLQRIADVIREHFRYDGEVTEATTATHIMGWDSLAHTIVIMKVERAFGIELPIEAIFELRNVGELAVAVQEQIDAA